ncbi:hypothetical protein ACFLV7_11950 [Chloroflexota bacterium]
MVSIELLTIVTSILLAASESRHPAAPVGDRPAIDDVLWQRGLLYLCPR